MKDNQNDANLDHLRHSLAHLLAASVMELWPDTKRTIGPAIENGFYFDFEFSKPISDTDLPKIEEKMREILPSWTSFERSEASSDEAKKEYPGNQYKHELIDEFSGKGEALTFYRSGNYTDLCRGGHVENPARDIDPQAFKLTKVAGAYWRGDEKNTMLTRIYGVAFATKADLDAHLVMLEEAAKRDHKVLGKKLDLFTFSELVGPGLPLFTPKGTMIRDLLDGFLWDLRRPRGYERVDIPHIAKKDLYEKSGHWTKFSDDLFRIKTREDKEFALKPMNCPHHTQIYNRKPWSYRELPQRYASTTKVYRDEQSGELGGLSRVLSITQDDAHVFCRLSQAKQEAMAVWDIVEAFYGAFGFELRVRLSMRDLATPEKYLGEPAQWDAAEKVLREVASERKADVFEGIGEAAFYGPKLDFMAKDSIGRPHQVATIQFDFNQPERFDLTCINENGEHERIVMLHAAIMGSIERFLSVLIEHVAGQFPVWLAPVQVRVLPVSDKFAAYGEEVVAALKEAGLRVEMSPVDETLGKRIRDTELEKVPYMVVVGEKEAGAKTVSARHYKRGQEEAEQLVAFVQKVTGEVRNKAV